MDPVSRADDMDYMHGRWCSPAMGKFLSVDLAPGRTGSPQTWNRYSYVANSPLTRVDPNGWNWFQVNGNWEWHEGSSYSYKDKDGNAQTLQSSYTHLVRFEKIKTNKLGAASGYLTLYDQDKVVARSIAFSGGDGHTIIPNGTYTIRADLRDVADSAGDLKPGRDDIAQFYGIQEISPYVPNDSGFLLDFRYEWGSIRAALNESPGMLGKEYLGNYIHGKVRTGNYTHGCICERSEQVLWALHGLDGKAVPVIPVEVK